MTRIRERAIAVKDNVNVAVYNLDSVRARFPNWHTYTKRVRHQLLRDRTVAPASEHSAHNVTCEGFHEHIADLLNHQSDTDDPASMLAFGDDRASGFSTTDAQLNNKVGDVVITDPGSDGSKFIISEFVSSLELNGYTLRELGIVSENGVLWNHTGLPSDIPKTDQTALVVNVDIPISDTSP